MRPWARCPENPPTSPKMSAMTAPRIAAVVVAWNRAELLRETLGALAQQSRPLDDIIVVDNASTDDTPQAIQGSEAVTDTVTLPSNFGGAGGFAAGIARAVSRGADFVWIMDDDTVPHVDALERLLEARAEYPGEPAVMACRAEWFDGREHPMNKPRRRAFLRPVLHQHAEAADSYQIRTASFVAILLDVRAIREDGLPEAAYFLWNDDFEYTARLLRRRVGLYVDAARVEHRTKTFGNSTASPGARFVNEVRNKMWAFGRSQAFGPIERCAFMAMTTMRWVRLLATSPDRTQLWNYLKEGVEQANEEPSSTADVLSDTPVACEAAQLDRRASRQGQNGTSDLCERIQQEQADTFVAEGAASDETLPFSVLLPVYIKDDPAHFQRALQSVGADQSLAADEIVIVCDGPVSPEIDEILDSARHGRSPHLVADIPIKVVRLERNRGLSAALNAGLQHCSYDIVARADADDISVPERFARQLPVMEQGFDIVGAAIVEFSVDENGTGMIRRQPTHQHDIVSAFTFHDPFNHPAVVYRASAVKEVGGYQHLDLMEDYWLFARMVASGARVTNLSDVLVKYRVGAGAYQRRGGLRLLKSEVELQRRLRSHRITTRGQLVRNLAIRATYRIVPTGLRRAGYRLWRQLSQPQA